LVSLLFSFEPNLDGVEISLTAEVLAVMPEIFDI